FGQVWTGAVDNNWNNPQNWSSNDVPTARIEIPLTNNQPIISQTVPNIQSLTLNEGASLDIEANGVLQIINGNSSIGISNKGTIQNQGSILIEEASSFGISNEGTLVNNGMIESNNAGTHGVFNFKSLSNNGQIKILSSKDIGIENIGTFDNTATIHIEASGATGLKNYLDFSTTGTIDILESGKFGLQNVGSFNNQGQINIHTTTSEGITNHEAFDNYGTINIESSNRAAILNYSTIVNHANLNILDTGLQGIMNYFSFINHGILDIQNVNKNGIENLNIFENNGTLQIKASQNVGIFNAATFINNHILSIDESITAGLWSQVKFENHGEMSVSNTTWSGIANLGIFTNFQSLEITNTFNRGIENQSTFTNEKCATILVESAIVNGLSSNIINWGFITTSFEGDNWNQSNITNHGIIEDLYDSFGTQPLTNIGMVVSPIQICHDKTLGLAIKKGEGAYLEATEIWYSNEEKTLSAGFYTQEENEYLTVMPLGDHWLYFEISDMQNTCTFPIRAKLNVAENPSMEVITTDVSCFGADNGSISITANGGSSEYTYLWNKTHLTESFHEELPADDYEITVIDKQSNCSVSDNIKIIEPPILSTNFEQSNWAAAPPMDKHAFNIEVAGGIAPYQYEIITEIEESETTVDVLELADNQFQIEASPLEAWIFEITDAHDCSYQFDLGEAGDDDINLPIIETAITINETDLGESDGTIEVTVANGDTSCGGYTYEWSNGDNDSEIDYLFAGGYTVIITDCAGNTTSAYVELERDGEKGTNRKAMKVFPSPARDWTNLRLISEDVDEVLVRLFDTNKQLVRTIYEGEVSGETMYETVIDLRALPSGVYYVHLTTPSGASLSKRILTIK
ncbi:MAG: hypothetical protein AB8B69_11755, partial [Chitinophagales bacterium]